MWRPDGWGWRARIGLLVPHADMCEEAEFMAMAPPGVSIHTTRVPFRGMGQGGNDGAQYRLEPAERIPCAIARRRRRVARLRARPVHLPGLHQHEFSLVASKTIES